MRIQSSTPAGRQYGVPNPLGNAGNTPKRAAEHAEAEVEADLASPRPCAISFRPRLALGRALGKNTLVVCCLFCPAGWPRTSSCPVAWSTTIHNVASEESFRGGPFTASAAIGRPNLGGANYGASTTTSATAKTTVPMPRTKARR